MTPARSNAAGKAGACQGAADHTALKWRCNGELSDLDLQRILERLQAVDPAAQSLRDHFKVAP